MKKEKMIKTITLPALAAILLFAPSIASAQFGGARFNAPLSAGSSTSTSLAAGRSYHCSVNSRGSYSLSTTIMAPDGSEISASRPALRQSQLEGYFFSSSDSGDTNLSNNSVTFSTPTGVEGFGDYTFSLAAVSEGASSVTLECRDTSLSCGFNTFVNEFNFLEVSNETPNPIAFDYFTRNFDGTVTEGNGLVLSGRRVDIDIHTPAGPNSFGSLVIRPKSAGVQGEVLNVRVSQYKDGKLSLVETCSPLPLLFDGFNFAIWAG